jgi:hypothetical protein
MRHRHSEAVRITSAARPRSEDIRGRERRYLISMGIRTVCFLLMVLSIGHWYAWLFLVAAALLPYVAVVAANAGARPQIEDEQFGYRPDLQAIEPPRRPVEEASAPPPVEELTCSAKSCQSTARWTLLWNNPKVHTPERRKEWLACDVHKGPLADFLGVRGFLKEIRSL